MIRQIAEEWSTAIFFDKLQHRVCQAITQVISGIIEVLVLAETKVFGEDDSLEALATGSHRSTATASQIPHAEESSGIATITQ